MDTAFGRYAFHVLVLLACAIATWHGADSTPTREVVELVSVVYKPARLEARAVDEPASIVQTAASPSTESNAEQVAPPKQVQSQGPVVVQHAKVAPRTEPPAPRPTKKFVKAQSEAKVPCSPPACPAADPAVPAVMKRTDTRPPKKAEPALPAEPPLPAVFVPVQRLGLYLQARLGVESDRKPAPGNGKL